MHRSQGSWGGIGIKKGPPKPHLIKKVAGVDPKSRADYGKAHVIISEKRDKKAAKYLVKDLPYPYTSKAQFERSMGTPLGTEWNTRVGFQRGTLPKVVTKVSLCCLSTEQCADKRVYFTAWCGYLAVGKAIVDIHVSFHPSITISIHLHIHCPTLLHCCSGIYYPHIPHSRTNPACCYATVIQNIISYIKHCTRLV